MKKYLSSFIMYDVDSSNIVSIGLFGKNVRYRLKNGLVFEYLNVGRKNFIGLMDSVSKGSFMHRNFKGIYKYRRLEDWNDKLKKNPFRDYSIGEIKKMIKEEKEDFQYAESIMGCYEENMNNLNEALEVKSN